MRIDKLLGNPRERLVDKKLCKFAILKNAH